jgi:hypothetical protein
MSKINLTQKRVTNNLEINIKFLVFIITFVVDKASIRRWICEFILLCNAIIIFNLLP